MFKLKHSMFFAIVFFTITNQAYGAISQEEYYNLCLQELEINQIPAFDCRDGIPIRTDRFGQECEVKPLLIGDGSGCGAGSWLGKLDVGNPDVEAIYICRKYQKGVDNGTISINDNNYSDIAMIAHNMESGKTCFFQSPNGSGYSQPGTMPSPQVSHYTNVSPQKQAWLYPAQTSGGNCASCHKSDAFLVTPYVLRAFTQLDLLRHRTPKGPYVIVGNPDFGYEWTNFGSFDVEQEEGCAGACHYLPEQGDAQSPYTDNPRYNQFIADSWMKNWMAPLGPPSDSFYVNKHWVFNEDVESFEQPLHNYGSRGWTRQTGSTPTGQNYETGPNGGANGSNYYYFLETSSNSTGATAILETDLFDPIDSTVSFNYHMYGDDVGDLYLDISVDGTWYEGYWHKDGQLPQNNIDQWQSASISLAFLSGFSKVKLRLRAVAIGGYKGDIAIDNFLVERQ